MLIDILYTIMLPIFVLIGIGVLFDKLFHPNVRTLTRLTFYVITPAVLLDMTAGSNLQAGEILKISLYAIAHSAVMFVFATAFFSVRPLRDKRALLTCASMFYNAGNYGIPLMLLAFGDQGVSVIGIILMIQALVMFTAGVLILGDGETSLTQSFTRFLKIPMIYAIIIGLALRALHVELGGPVKIVLDHLVGGFVPVSLVTLGIQLSQSQVGQDFGSISAAAGARLLLSPLVAAGLVLLLGFDQSIAAVLVLGAGLPIAVNVYILAIEFDREPVFASLMVFWTTVMSAISIPLLLLLIKLAVGA